MTSRLYNTLTREKADFVPLDPANVRMYVCGPTVYDFAHIGNARPVIVFDVLFRLLRHLYGADHVTYARNITDVDDKIIARAAEEGVGIDDLTKRTERQFHEDAAALGCLAPTVEPRATEHIGQMIDMIERLIARGCAYEADGHVLFHVPSMPDYGRLARRSLDEMQAGARVEVAPYKRDPMDFVLWKPARQEARSAEGATGKDQGGEPGWESPWGRGRPGWHIECSAMAEAHLGETFDIHGGGIDLVFPHHENEVAQSRCAHGTDVMANVWMHNGFLQVEGEKMSKSLGNFVTIREVLADWPGDVVRHVMTSTHYRQPLDWTELKCEKARDELLEWGRLVLRDPLYGKYDNNEVPSSILAALEDDLNTPEAFSVLRSLFTSALRGGARQERDFSVACAFLGYRKLNEPGLFERGLVGRNVGKKRLFENIGNVNRLRAAIANNNIYSSNIISNEIEKTGVSISIDRGSNITLRGNDSEIERKIKAREQARKARDFAEADRIRDELASMGIQLKDNPDGTTTWEFGR